MVKPDWQKGEPAELKAGMLIRTSLNEVLLVGDLSDWGNIYGHSDSSITLVEWAWAIKPHELEWLGGKEAK